MRKKSGHPTRPVEGVVVSQSRGAWMMSDEGWGMGIADGGWRMEDGGRIIAPQGHF